jgi:hypothetical protein
MHLIFTALLVGIFLYFVILRPAGRRVARGTSSRKPHRALARGLGGPKPRPLSAERKRKLEDMAGTAYAHRDSGFEPKREHARAIWTLRVHGEDSDGGIPGPSRPPKGSAKEYRRRMRASRVRRGRRMDRR